MSVGINSRFNYSPIIRLINTSGLLVEREHLDVRPRLSLITSEQNIELNPATRDNWSNIAWRTLGNGQFYWIIADYTGIVDPFTELKPKTELKYVTQLAANVGTGSINTITVNDPEKIKRGDKIRVEDLDPANLTSFDIAVLSVNDTTGVVLFTPITVGTAVPALLSRVSKITTQPAVLIVPPANRALFEGLDFNNALAAFVE